MSDEYAYITDTFANLLRCERDLHGAKQRIATLEAELVTARKDRLARVWLQAWSATVNANDCKNPDTATKYADACLKDFKERFPS